MRRNAGHSVVQSKVVCVASVPVNYRQPHSGVRWWKFPTGLESAPRAAVSIAKPLWHGANSAISIISARQH